MSKPNIDPGNFELHFQHQNQPLFWHLLHLRDPKKFMFGTKLQLISHMDPEMELFEKFSEEIFRKVVRVRNRWLKRPKSEQIVTNSSIQESLIEIFNLRNSAETIFQWFHCNFLLKIIEKTEELGENLWNLEPKFKEIFMITFWRFLAIKKVYLRIGQGELIGKGIFDMVQMLIVQIWYLQKHLFDSEYIPVPEEFFTSDIAIAECFFTSTDLLRYMKRSQEHFNLFIYMHPSNSALPERHEFVLDSEFLKLLPECFLAKFKWWTRDVRLAVDRLRANMISNRHLLQLRPTQNLNFWEIPFVFRELLDDLLNNAAMRVLDSEWMNYILEMVADLETTTLAIPRAVEELDEEKMTKFVTTVIRGNPSLNLELSKVLPSKNVGELRVVLAQLFRFCCRFTGSLMRYLFMSKWAPDGNTVESFFYSLDFLDEPRKYDLGKWAEKQCEETDPFQADDFDFDVYFNNDELPVVEAPPTPPVEIPPPAPLTVEEPPNPVVMHENPEVRENHRDAKRSQRAIRNLTENWDEDEEEMRMTRRPSSSNTGKSSSHQETGSEKKEKSHRRHRTPGGTRIASDSKNKESRRHTSGARRAPSSTRHRESGRARETSRVRQTRPNTQESSERQERIRRRHHTPAPPRISTPIVKTPPIYYQTELHIDNDSNDVPEEPPFDIHPWILYNYPIIPTIVNNETPDYVF